MGISLVDGVSEFGGGAVSSKCLKTAKSADVLKMCVEGCTIRIVTSIHALIV